MNRFLLALIISGLAGLSTGLGGLIGIIYKGSKVWFLVFCMGLASGIMLTVSFLDLIPGGIVLMGSTSLIMPVLIFLTGLLFCALLESFVPSGEGLYKTSIMTALAILLHNLPEGITTFALSYTDLSMGISVSVGVAMHNIPEGIAIAVPMRYSGRSRMRALTLAFLSGLAEPAGAFIAYAAIKLGMIISGSAIGYLLLFIAGIMSYTAVLEILPEAVRQGRLFPVISGFLVGTVIMSITVFIV